MCLWADSISASSLGSAPFPSELFQNNCSPSLHTLHIDTLSHMKTHTHLLLPLNTAAHRSRLDLDFLSLPVIVRKNRTHTNAVLACSSCICIKMWDFQIHFRSNNKYFVISPLVFLHGIIPSCLELYLKALQLMCVDLVFSRTKNTDKYWGGPALHNLSDIQSQKRQGSRGMEVTKHLLKDNWRNVRDFYNKNTGWGSTNKNNNTKGIHY